jgi:hypothetical protein
MHRTFWLKNLNGRDHLDLSIDGRILKGILKTWNIRAGLISSELGPVMGSCEHGDELSCFIKSGEFFDQLSGYQLHKENEIKHRLYFLYDCSSIVVTV